MKTNNSQLLVVPRVLWGALCFATVIYFFVAKQSGHTVEGDNPLFFPLAGMAVMNLAMAFIISDFVFKSGAEKLEQPVELSKILPFYLTSFILKMALAESCAVIGLVLALQSGINNYYPFWLAALAVMLTAFPSEEKIIEKAKRAKQKA